MATLIPGFDSGPVNDASEKIRQVSNLLALNIPAPDYRRGYAENPSHHQNSKWKLPEFDWQAERNSQWVRATYPYVESYREPMIYWMQKGFSVFDLELSNAATYYTHWTNRYTLAKAWEIRSNFGAGAGRLTPRMFILNDSDAANKGYEIWVTDDDEAEKHFVVYGVAYRPASKAFFASVLFPKSDSKGSIAIASAMIYNANSRNVPSQGSNIRTTQLDNGWDTLNWLPPVKAHEWGGQRPASDNGQEPWNVLKGSLEANANAKVQTNWQAKLVPLTLDVAGPQKLKQSINQTSSKLSAEIKELSKEALQRPELIKH
jgi:hypothetical protein